METFYWIGSVTIIYLQLRKKISNTTATLAVLGLLVVYYFSLKKAQSTASTGQTAMQDVATISNVVGIAAGAA